jgi:hypothetical protein
VKGRAREGGVVEELPVHLDDVNRDESIFVFLSDLLAVFANGAAQLRKSLVTGLIEWYRASSSCYHRLRSCQRP